MLLALLLLLSAAATKAADLPGCASGLQHWLDARAEIMTRDVLDVDERQHLAPTGSVNRVRYRFDDQGELQAVESSAGELRRQNFEYSEGRLRKRVDVAASGVRREFAVEYAREGYHYVETESTAADGEAGVTRARFYLARFPAVSGNPPAGSVSPAAAPSSVVAFRDACLAELIDPRDDTRQWSIQYVEYNAQGLDLFSASARYAPPPAAAGDAASLFRMLDGVIARTGLDERLEPQYSQTRVEGFRSAQCQGTSVLSVVGSSRRELLSHIGALDGYWVVLDAAGRVCLSRYGGRTARYQYALDGQGNWIAKQEFIRDVEPGQGPNGYQPGNYFEREIHYR